MRITSKFFTPPLCEKDRQVLKAALGLSSFAFGTVEFLEDLPVAAKIFSQDGVRSLLSPTDREGLASLFVSYPVPWVSIRHKGSSFAHEILQGERTLWEELMPSPLRRFMRKNKNVAVEFYPPALGQELKQVSELLDVLEKKLAGNEFSLLKIRSFPKNLTLCFHYVRGSRVRVGIWNETADEYQDTQGNGWYTHSRLGSPMAVLNLCTTTSDASPWNKLSQALTELNLTKLRPWAKLPPYRELAESLGLT